MQYDPSTMPKTDEEADQRLLYVARCYVVEREMPVRTACRLIESNIREKSNVETLLVRFKELISEPIVIEII